MSAGGAAWSAIGRGELALMPLPAGALGADVGGLPLARDSGVVTNSEAASDANGPTTAAELARLGRLTGYQLDYGGDSPATGKLYEVETEVELYQSSVGARAGLAFWRKDNTKTSALRALGISLSMSLSALPALGPGAFGVSGIATVKGAPPFRGVEVAFAHGDIVGMVTIDGQVLATMRSLAIRDALALRVRIAGVLAGRITGPAAALPGKLKVGPLSTGPNLETLALTPTDFTLSRVTSEGYTDATTYNAISAYQRTLEPAGSIGSLKEQVELYPDAITALAELVGLRRLFTSPAGLKKIGFNTSGEYSYHPHSVPVAAGDQSFTVFGVANFANGKSADLGYTIIRVGSTLELLTFATPTTSPLSNAAIAALASAAAEQAAHHLQSAPVA